MMTAAHLPRAPTWKAVAASPHSLDVVRMASHLPPESCLRDVRRRWCLSSLEVRVRRILLLDGGSIFIFRNPVECYFLYIK